MATYMKIWVGAVVASQVSGADESQSVFTVGVHANASAFTNIQLSISLDEWVLLTTNNDDFVRIARRVQVAPLAPVEPELLKI